MINIEDTVIHKTTGISMKVCNIKNNLYECYYFYGQEGIHKVEWFSPEEIEKRK